MSAVDSTDLEARLDPRNYLPSREELPGVSDESYELADEVLGRMFENGDCSGGRRATVAASGVYVAGIVLHGESEVTQDDVAEAAGTSSIGVRRWMQEIARALQGIDVSGYVSNDDEELDDVRTRINRLAAGESARQI